MAPQRQEQLRIVPIDRPGHYTKGRQIQAIASVLPIRVKFKPGTNLHIYSISFSPQLPGDFRRQNRIVADMKAKLSQELNMQGECLFTGTALLTIRHTDIQGDGSRRVTFEHCYGGHTYAVTVRWRNEVPMSVSAIDNAGAPLEIRARMRNALSFYVDNAVRTALRRNREFWAQRDSFYDISAPIDLTVDQSLKLALARGFRTSTLSLEAGPFVSVSINHLIICGNAWEMIRDILARTQGTDEAKQQAVNDALRRR
ncbi:unnamed protein product [Vitrella brassicaformis CCMP3155]|uniref:Uncharacterized protein n=1 Tax=Vitrella brassicaformis (strain CCMP3155) TaxID=1169540 RepID=A0A0G4FZI9_VITBC|nr:unnamed protein product [Vitrella brassicaformis CCMP3155]|mmetsp:Transcript_44489/g.125826  ORF Transcript_44489/g.125826 Transcript_44489/m.125826 type:complete len:256 (-) Transcript_44489:71-838(-)|eukprot:CEM20943.1 unnamed protein product [Vitrella brassicaformis CCMP3155]